MRLHHRVLVGALLGGTAISPAFAEDRLHVEVGGEYVQYFGYANNDDIKTGDFSGFDAKFDTDNAITFQGDVTLDNGLQVGMYVGLLAFTGEDQDQIDGSYLWMENRFGRVELGQNDGAPVLMHYAAPDVGFGVNDSDISDWIVNPSGGDSDSAFQSTYLYLGDDKATKVSYFTPRYEGVQFGISYVPQFNRDDNTAPSGSLYQNAVEAAVNFERTFGDVEVKLAAGYLHADKPDGSTSGIKDAEGYSLGGNLGYGGFTFGASFADTQGNGSGGTDSAVSLDGHGYDVGIAYAFDAYQVSLSYYNGRFADSSAAGDSKHQTVMLSGTYELGPGVSLLASIFKTKYDADTGTSNDGWAALTGVSLEF